MQTIAEPDHDTGRFPLRPALAAAANRAGRPGSITLLADATGIPRTTLSRWNVMGLTADAADEVAVALGHHPGELWPDWFASAEPEGVS